MAEKKAKHEVDAEKSRESKEDSRAPSLAWVPTWEIVEWFKSEGPLPLQILDSRTHGEKYVVEIRATNLTVHGIYVDSTTLVTPTELILQMSPKRITFGADEQSAKPKSMLIRSGLSLEFTVEFPVPAHDDLNTDWFGWFKSEKRLGLARVEYLILNEDSRRKRNVAFSIRLP